MKIIIVGASGIMGSYLSELFGRDHDIIRVGCKIGDIQADITSPASIAGMYKQAGAFDALISTAGPTHVGPWKKMSVAQFRDGLEGKLLGQINLVLIGQDYVKPKGSFTLITGVLTQEPQRDFAHASAANGAVEAFVRAAAIELENGVRINAVIPTTKMEDLEYGFRKSVFGAGTGQVIQVR